ILRVARAACLREHRPALAAAWGGTHRHRDAFVRQELVQRALELRASAKWSALPAWPSDRVGAWRALASAALSGVRRLRDRRELRIRATQAERLQAHLQLAPGPKQHHLPFERALVLGQVRLVVD